MQEIDRLQNRDYHQELFYDEWFSHSLGQDLIYVYRGLVVSYTVNTIYRQAACPNKASSKI